MPPLSVRDELGDEVELSASCEKMESAAVTRENTE